jgi:hypothetical protein
MAFFLRELGACSIHPRLNTTNHTIPVTRAVWMATCTLHLSHMFQQASRSFTSITAIRIRPYPTIHVAQGSAIGAVIIDLLSAAPKSSGFHLNRTMRQIDSQRKWPLPQGGTVKHFASIAAAVPPLHGTVPSSLGAHRSDPSPAPRRCPPSHTAPPDQPSAAPGVDPMSIPC